MEGTCFDEDWATVVASEAALQRVIARLHQAGSELLGPVMGQLDRVRRLAEAGQVGALAEGLSRGDVRASDAASPVRGCASGRRPMSPAVPRRWCG